ncbi:alpha/beta hydrolase [Amorphus orientalis]|uniref:Alpha-beta hydrolase superfamily lysophospholipase n=1 Tax=Amorphus orientalis TaxID=649198 RepID=A0AAE3VQI7_9HYPH|nr:alpha/beta fold hydrolase [Amorphus orientalis]MDQ0316321.1 alpha-beta hydrolase superfamily lysophospholipase [Amorphus orientalis]
MSALMEWFGPVTVMQRAVIGIAAILLVLALLVGLTALLIGLRRALVAWLVLLVGGGGLLAFLPVSTDGLVSDPDPTSTYEAGVARFEAETADPPQLLNPLCEPKLHGHGERTDKVFVLVHGVSSCPQAYVDFAPILFERGHNVLVLRMPQNGYADRATDALRLMTAEQLAEFGDSAVDMATGLGEEVVFVGISAGGTIAGWVAQNRADVDRAVLLAPFFGLHGFGPDINRMLMRAMLLIPDVSIWKDPVARENAENVMPHAYKRQSTTATGQIMRLGYATWHQARETKAAASQIVVVTNEADTAVSNSTTDAVAETWQESGVPLVSYVFDASHGLGHELIDPMEPGADPDLTYPIILSLAETGRLPD